MSELPEIVTRRTVGLWDIPRVLLTPRQVFARVEDVPAWGWPLVILLTVVTLIGYATVETGLIDREIDLDTRTRIAEIDCAQRDVVERSTLRDLYDNQYKAGEFAKLLMRVRVIGAEPVQALATALLIASVLYGATALTGRKPEWHTLLTICVFAGFVDALRLLVLLALRVYFRTLEVDTSPALLLRLLPASVGGTPSTFAIAASLLTAVDPFVLWYWVIIVVGLAASAQLPGWRAWLLCLLCWLTAAGGRCALAAAMLRGAAGGGAPAG